MSIRIPPKEACECSSPIPWLSYYGIKNCKLCNFLIPRSDTERTALRERRFELEVREGLAFGRGKVPVDKWHAEDIITGALKSDPALTSTQLRRIISNTGPLTISDHRFMAVIAKVRKALGITISKGAGGGRPRKYCISFGCRNPVGPNGYCRDCNSAAA